LSILKVRFIHFVLPERKFPFRIDIYSESHRELFTSGYITLIGFKYYKERIGNDINVERAKVDTIYSNENQAFDRTNSIVDINDIWHTDLGQETYRSDNSRRINGETNPSIDNQAINQNKHIYVTWSDINVSLPKNTSFFNKLKYKIKKENVSKPKTIIEDGKLLKLFNKDKYV